MKIDASGYFATVTKARDEAVDAERLGYDGWFTPETQTDPFVGSALASNATNNAQIGTAIVVAFARNPMTVALQANDVQLLSKGRCLLGLGSQIQPHITNDQRTPPTNAVDADGVSALPFRDRLLSGSRDAP